MVRKKAPHKGRKRHTLLPGVPARSSADGSGWPFGRVRGGAVGPVQRQPLVPLEEGDHRAIWAGGPHIGRSGLPTRRRAQARGTGT